MKAFDYYNKCKWICPACLQKQNGFIKKLATQYYLECLRCKELVTDQQQIADLVNITVGDTPKINMVLGFKKRFVEPIISGSKVHTIREDSKSRWYDGLTIHMATGTRTKYYNCFMQTKCLCVERIFMSLNQQEIIEISIGDKYLYIPEKEILAINDGFKDYSAFEQWWHPILKNSEGEKFSGKIIHWTNYKYSND